MVESVTLRPHEHAKLDIVHVGVTRQGFVATAGEVHDIADAEVVEIVRVPVSVARSGEDYTFTRQR